MTKCTEWYCYRCGNKVPVPRNNKPRICNSCKKVRKEERKEYWKKRHKLKKRAQSGKSCPKCKKPMKEEEWYDLENDVGEVIGVMHIGCKKEKRLQAKGADKK